MTSAQLLAYDHFLDENDWDIYYWATQEPTPTSAETAEGGAPAFSTPSAAGTSPPTPPASGRAQAEATGPSTPPMPTMRMQSKTSPPPPWPQEPASASTDAQAAPLAPVKPSKGEWAQTVGTFKPAYRPVPARWRNSEILSMLREHVMRNSAGGVHDGGVHDGGDVIDVAGPAGGREVISGEGRVRAPTTGGKGLGFMPELTPVS